MTKNPKYQSQSLVEALDLTASQVDRESGVIRNVKLLGLVSKNGREYLREACSKALNLYEGVPVNIDHQRKQDAGEARSYRDRIGYVSSPSLREDGVYGDININRGVAEYDQIMEDAEKRTPGVGMSHESMGRIRRDGNRVIVEAITKVKSVDLVSGPATTSSLFEAENISNELQTQEDETMDLKDLTLDQLKEGRTDLIEAIVSPVKEELMNQIAVLEGAKAKLEADAEGKAVIEAVDKMVEATGKTAEQIGTSLIEHCYSLDADVAQGLIKEQAETVSEVEKAAGEKDPTSRHKDTGIDEGVSNDITKDQFSEAITS